MVKKVRIVVTFSGVDQGMRVEGDFWSTRNILSLIWVVVTWVYTLVKIH